MKAKPRFKLLGKAPEILVDDTPLEASPNSNKLDKATIRSYREWLRVNFRTQFDAEELCGYAAEMHDWLTSLDERERTECLALYAWAEILTKGIRAGALTNILKE